MWHTGCMESEQAGQTSKSNTAASNNTAAPTTARQRRVTRVWDEAAARAFLAQADTYNLATVRADGAPVARPLNGVMVDDWLLFHGAFAGEKMDCLGQPAVVSAYTAVATLPSYFFDPVLACPATTYFKSAMGHGTLLAVDAPELKARMLQALMEKHQPEGGHAHFIEDADVYHKELKSVRVFGVRLEQVAGKCNLGQDRPPERTMNAVRGLYRRGAPGDVQAVESILEMSPAARPTEWQWESADHQRYSLVVCPTPELARQHAQLLVGQYWRANSSADAMIAAIVASQAWVGLVDDTGQLLGAARATSDQVWVATLSDVVVQPQWRGRGLGTTLMRSLLDHPTVRGCVYQRLGTADAMDFYGQLGFVAADVHAGVQRSHWMVRRGVLEGS